MEIKKINLPFDVKKPVLAFGSQTKNTLCFVKGRHAYISRVHPNLGNLPDFLAFEEDAEYFLKKRPKIIAYDLHPEYQSTKFALSLRTTSYELRAVQHHHAHIVSCMADNGLSNQRVIGVAFDGTGLGIDGALWGAEFLICDYNNFLRQAHLREVALLGGEKAIMEPWRVAIAWLHLIYKDKFFGLKVDFIKKIDKNKWKVLKNILLKRVNTPLASSMGRFFDAAASLILARQNAGFEAELAIELEKLARAYRLPATNYELNSIKSGHKYIIDPTSIFMGIIKDLQLREPKDKIAYKFHLTIAKMIEKTCLALRKESNINKVVLSGGVFRNSLLLKLGLDLLYKHGFQVFTHKKLPCNDACVSLGQAIAAM